ncbi:hypothetical protein D0T84_10955 [Dysgonomonas sp. 521]|uniref:lipocalin family protein n=1 Tax=Dysgonomonas sp. 521 TaxID=2302932 RepID=UPI0013D616D6|nr:lipocalin family protein [Dysgonomonas sp. 521]NDV95430.1 hypothetical protein [Dysgonomonas sp. 521]
MKKTVLFSMFVMLFTITSCTDEGNENQDPIVGKWIATNVKSNGILIEWNPATKQSAATEDTSSNCYLDSWIKFNDNKLVEMFDACENKLSAGTWKQNGKQLTIDMAYYPSTIEIINLTGNSMKCTMKVFYNEYTHEEFEIFYERVDS